MKQSGNRKLAVCELPNFRKFAGKPGWWGRQARSLAGKLWKNIWGSRSSSDIFGYTCLRGACLPLALALVSVPMLLSGGASAQTVQVLAPVAGLNPTQQFLLPRVRENYGCGRGAGLHFVVRLSAANAAAVAVGYTLTGTATIGDDYVDGTGVTRLDGSLYSSDRDIDDNRITSTTGDGFCVQGGTARGTGTLTIAAGDTEGDIFIEVVDDDITTEEDETVVVTLTSASAGATISTTAGESSATGTIEDNEAEYLLRGITYSGEDRGSYEGTVMDPVRVSEGVDPDGFDTVWHCVLIYDSSLARVATGDTPFEITFDWEVEFYRPGAGNADRSDLGAPASGTVSIAAGSRSGCFAVPLVDDDLIENSERFAVVFRNATPAGRVNFYDDTGGTSEYGGSTEHITLFGPARADRPAASRGKLDVVIEDDEQGVVFSTASLTFEEGATATTANEYTINLREAPDRDVTVTPSVSDNSYVTITPATLTFTPGDGTVAQTVTVTATEDSNISEGSATIAHSVAGLTSATSVSDIDSIQVTITEAAGQTAGILVYGRGNDPAGSTNVSITFDECDAGPPFVSSDCGGFRRSSSYRISLQAAPAASETVVITATIQDPDHGLTFGTLGAPTDPPTVTTVTFTAANWQTAGNPFPGGLGYFEIGVQSLGTHDDDSRDETVVISHTVSSTGGTTPVYASLTTADSVRVTIVDNEIDGVSSDAFGSTLYVPEEGSTTYDVVLDTDPLGTVEVTISSDDSAAVNVQKSGGTAAAMVTLTFTSSDWSTAQTVTVTAENDANTVRELVTLSHAVSGYGAVTDAGTVSIQVLDDEAGDDVLYAESASLTILEGGPAKTYSLLLSTAPSATVTVTATPDATLSVTPLMVEFTTANWNVAQSLTVSLAEDTTANPALAISHAATPTSLGYTSPSDLVVTVIDNDLETRVRLSLSVGEANARVCAVTYPDNSNIDPTDDGLLDCTAFFLASSVHTPVALPPVLDVIIPENFHEFSIFAAQLPQQLFGDGDPDFDFAGGQVALDLQIGPQTDEDGAATVTFPTAGLEVCLPVPTDMYEARMDREVALVYHDGTEWSDITGTDGLEDHDFDGDYAGKLCAAGRTATDFETFEFDSVAAVSPYAVAFLGRLPAVMGEEPVLPEEEPEEPEEPDINQMAMDVLVPEVARAIATNVSGAVAGRIARVISGIPGGVPGGVPEGSSELVSVSLAGHSGIAGALAANERALNEGGLSLRDLLGSSSFDLWLDDAGAGAVPDGGVGIWASGDYNHLEGSADMVGPWDGDVFSAHVGVDRRFSENVLAGLAVSLSEGSFDFDDDETLATETRMTTVSPYFGWTLDKDRYLWASIGYGRGDVEQDKASRGTNTMLTGRKSDLTLATVSAGGSRRIAGDDALTLALKGDVLAGQVKVKDGGAGGFEAVKTDVQRLRVALELESTQVRDSKATVQRSAELALRHDGGDGNETGLGVELGGLLSWSRPDGRLIGELNGRILLLHEEDDVQDWGVGGLIRYQTQSAGRGLSFQVQPVYGQTASGTERIWNQGPTEIEPAIDDRRDLQLLVDAGYGLSELSGRGLLTPYGGLQLSGSSNRIWRLGTRFEIDSGYEIDLGGRHRERGDASSEYNSINLLMRMYW